MRRKGARGHLLSRELGQIRANGTHVGRTRVDVRALTPIRKTLQS